MNEFLLILTFTCSVAVIGAQWGDEGKGKLVDLLTGEADICCRFNGGSNAGHTIKFEGTTFKFNLLPCGIAQPKKINIIGNGCVVHLPRLKEELDDLTKKGVSYKDRIFLSRRAHLLFDFHQHVDGKREGELGKKKIGTTKKGIGPCYSSKAIRHGIRAGDLENFETFTLKLKVLLQDMQKMYKFEWDLDKEIEKYKKLSEFVKPMLMDSVVYLNKALKNNKKLLLEGANAIMLDLDFGTYPYVTSSSTGVSGPASGLGIPPKRVTNCLGIMKAYCTRVGEGPFPTELHGKPDDALRAAGHEFGVTTGRPRRCGWLDLVQIKYAHMVNDFDTLGMTKLDVLNIFDEIKLGVKYIYDGKELEVFPSRLEVLEKVEVVYETFKGWKGEDLTKCRKFSDLPKNAQVYVKRVEEILRIPIKWIGVGPDRVEIIEQYPFFFKG